MQNEMSFLNELKEIRLELGNISSALKEQNRLISELTKVIKNKS